jgi:hypothetical protein
MAQTVVKHRSPRPRGDKSVGSLSRIERDLKAYELHLAGCTVRGVCEELSLKSTKTGWDAIERGKQYAIEHGINVEERRIEIDKLFKQTLGLLVKTAYDQDAHGQIETIHGPDGTIVKTRKGLDPRIAGELSRSLNRWAEFCGLLERAPEVNQASTTLIQLAAPADGASFGSKWAGEAVEISASDHGSDHVDVAANSAVLSRSEVSGK